ncbi:hypothetical protein RCL1_004545 [Eukaryota sp. TZLM3-RCL]
MSALDHIKDFCKSWASAASLTFKVESQVQHSTYDEFSVVFFPKSPSNPVPLNVVNVTFLAYPDRISGLDVLLRIEDEELVHDTSKGANPSWLHSVLKRKQIVCS